MGEPQPLIIIRSIILTMCTWQTMP